MVLKLRELHVIPTHAQISLRDKIAHRKFLNVISTANSVCKFEAL